MCGIAGKVVFSRHGQAPREVVGAMTGALAHRGPDGSGFYFAPNVALGHRRLDIAGRERQPLGNQTQTVWVTLDGEVFNARDLRTELQARGRRFSTTSNAEVIVHGYEEWGDRVVERLRGAFALAIWDAARARLVLGRDRLGIKPLCYSVLDGRGLVFASELRALLEDPEVSRDWDPAAIKEYLTLGYVPSPATIFRRIVRLPPGHLLTAEHGRVRITRYWEVAFGAAEGERRERECVEHLGDLLGEVTRMQAAGDTPVTALLSPHAGSAAILASLCAAPAPPVVATTVAFDAPPFSEVAQARTIAKHLGCRHHADLVTPRLADLVPRLAWYFDEPFADPSAVTTYHLASAARAHAPVALAAVGSNEIWAGRPSYRLERAEARARRWLGPARFGVGLVGQLFPVPPNAVRSVGHLVLPESEACARNRAAFGSPSRAFRLCTREFVCETDGVDPFFSIRSVHEACTSRDGLARALYVDLKTRLVDDVLTRFDRMSAAAALQMRLPMLDHQVVEFAASVPSNLKLRGDTTQYLLRRLLDGRMPQTLLRDSRHPFEAQPAAWLRGPLASLTSDVLLSGRFRQRGIFDSKAVTRAWQAHLTGHRDYHRELWSLLMLELWFEQFVDGAERRLRAA
jgi:asparagine synthase (glutamine-hydrolysing)